MINIEQIFIEDTSLSEIPSKAFNVLNKLEEIYYFDSHSLISIGNRAFYELNNLKILYIWNQIDF